jgi:hypothetical protein
MAGRDAGGRGSRAVLAQLDARLAELDRELAGLGELMAERRRLLAARAAITGERPPVAGGLVHRVTQEQVADYLERYPGSRASVVARALGVPLTNISQHLHRGRDTRFERRSDGWHVRARSERQDGE